MKFSPESGRHSSNSAEKISPDELVRNVERIRISASEVFSDQYSDYAADMERVKNIDSTYNAESQESRLGKVAEALIITSLGGGRTGELVELRAANLYDDYFHGVDAIIEQRQGGDTPALATIDVTINQADIKGSERQGGPLAEARPVGLEKKLSRIKQYIDRLSSFDPEAARKLSGWMRSGGLHEPRTKENAQLFRQAEDVILMKYYVTPETSPEPQKPGYVVGGPQAVVSIDTVFVNKALQGNQEAAEMIQALGFLEFAYSVHVEHEYLEQKVRERRDRNMFFDIHYAKVNAWYRILGQPQFDRIIKEYATRFGHNPDFKKQLAYYLQTLSSVFKGKK